MLFNRVSIGKRMLSLAARAADIVSIDPIATADGRKDFAYLDSDVMANQIGWVCEAAGTRFDALELHVLMTALEVTDDSCNLQQLFPQTKCA